MIDNRIEALRSLELFARGIVPSRMPANDYEPRRQDGIDFQNDLLILTSRVDRVIKAYGDYLLQHGIVSQDDVEKHFTDTLERALVGNALYCIESGIEQRINERAA